MHCNYVSVEHTIVEIIVVINNHNKIIMKHENLKCMGIMQDDLCHPYILSTAVLSDNYVWMALPFTQ